MGKTCLTKFEFNEHLNPAPAETMTGIEVSQALYSVSCEKDNIEIYTSTCATLGFWVALAGRLLQPSSCAKNFGQRERLPFHHSSYIAIKFR